MNKTDTNHLAATFEVLCQFYVRPPEGMGLANAMLEWKNLNKSVGMASKVIAEAMNQRLYAKPQNPSTLEWWLKNKYYDQEFKYEIPEGKKRFEVLQYCFLSCNKEPFNCINCNKLWLEK